MTSVNRKMRLELAPMIEILFVSQVSQMTNHAALLAAQRFANISIISFKTAAGNGEGGCYIHEETGFAHQLIPFLQSFGFKLKRVAFSDADKALSGMMERPGDEDGIVLDDWWDRRAFPLHTVIHQLCRAFQADLLPRDLRIDHLFCPWPHPHGPEGDQCHLCRDVARSFPATRLVGASMEGDAVFAFP